MLPLHREPPFGGLCKKAVEEDQVTLKGSGRGETCAPGKVFKLYSAGSGESFLAF